MTSRLVPVFTVLLYAVSYPIGALAVSAVEPFMLIAFRFAITSLVLWSWFIVRRRGSAGRSELAVPRGAQLLWGIVAGMLVQGMQFLALYWALAHGVGPGICALIIAMNPVATSLLNRASHGAREGKWGHLALVAGVIGVAAACAPTIIADPRLGSGFVAVLIALFGLAAGSLVQGRRLKDVNPIVFTAIGTTASIPAAAIMAMTEIGSLAALPRAVPIVLTLVLTSTLATTLYAACVRRSGARAASVLFAVIPAVAALAAWMIQGTAIGVPVLVGLTFGSIACVAQVRSSRRNTVAEQAVPARQP